MNNLAYDFKKPIYKEEMIDGEKFRMGPTPSIAHYRSTSGIKRMLESALDGGVCEVFTENVSLFLSEKDYVQPDVMVVCNPEFIRDKGIYGPPEFVAEVLSPRTALYDRHKKLEMYGRYGVKECWLVDTGSLVVEVFLHDGCRLAFAGGYRLYDEDELSDLKPEDLAAIKHEVPVTVLPGVSLKLTDIFMKIPR